VRSFYEEAREYQRWAKKKIVKLPGSLVAFDMGMGKTIVTLMAIRELLYTEIGRVLIVAPLEVAQNTWPDEIGEWYETKRLKFSVIVGDPKQRRVAAKSSARIHMINRENLGWLVALHGKNWPYDTVVWDDAGGLKSWKFRTKNRTMTRFGLMAKIRPKLKKFILLTGTPTPNGIIDIGGQMRIVDMGERLGAKKSYFLGRWFDADYMGWDHTPKPKAFEEIMDRCKDVMFSLEAEDYIDLPPRIIVPQYASLPKKLQKEYEQFERDLVSESYDVEAVSSGVLHNKLLQFANGFMYRNYDGDDGKRARDIVKIHREKIPVLRHIREETSGENLLVAYEFKPDVTEILKEFPNATVYDNEPDFVRLWKKGKIKMGIAHPASLGHGLNLQDGGHLQAWYGLTNSLELWQQFNRRLQRSGQSAEKVFIYPILMKRTADETTFASLKVKDTTQKAVNNAVKARIRENA
jgi:SNF2-related domain